MRRITTTVDPGVYSQLEDLAHRDGVATAHLIREAMERYVSAREREIEPLPLPDWTGMLTGDGEPLAERVDDIVDDVVQEIYRTEVHGEPKRRRG